MAKVEQTGNRVQGRHLTIARAADQLGVSIATVYRYMANGDLRYFKVGGTRVIDEGDLLECKDNRESRMFSSFERARMQRRAAAHALHALYDSRQITQPARDAFLRRFEVLVDPDERLSIKERKRRADQAKQAYFTDLARRSSKARGGRRRGHNN